MKHLELQREFCKKLNTSIDELVAEFCDKYYTEKVDGEVISTPYVYCIDHQEDGLRYNRIINDDYWNIDSMYTALWYDMEQDVLIEWLDERMEYKGNINLKNFYKLSKDNESS